MRASLQTLSLTAAVLVRNDCGDTGDTGDTGLCECTYWPTGSPRTWSGEGSAKRNLLVSWLTIWTSKQKSRILNEVQTRSHGEGRERTCCVWKHMNNVHPGVWLVTCLSISRSAYLMLGSWRVMAGFFLEKKSLKMRLMMLSKPPRMSCNKKVKKPQWLRPPSVSISYQLFETSAGRCLTTGILV